MKIANILSAILGLVLATLSIQWIFNPEAAADSLGMLYLEGEGRNTQIRDFTAFFAASSLFCLFAFFTFRSSWLLAAGLIYLFALGFNVYHVMYLGGEVQTQLFVEVVLSVWILGTALLMRSAASSKPVVKEATADTE